MHAYNSVMTSAFLNTSILPVHTNTKAHSFQSNVFTLDSVFVNLLLQRRKCFSVDAQKRVRWNRKPISVDKA